MQLQFVFARTRQWKAVNVQCFMDYQGQGAMICLLELALIHPVAPIHHINPLTNLSEAVLAP